MKNNWEENCFGRFEVRDGIEMEVDDGGELGAEYYILLNFRKLSFVGLRCEQGSMT